MAPDRSGLVEHVLDLAYAAAREHARYWYENDPHARRWIVSGTYRALRVAVERLAEPPTNDSDPKQQQGAE